MQIQNGMTLPKGWLFAGIIIFCKISISFCQNASEMKDSIIFYSSKSDFKSCLAFAYKRLEAQKIEKGEQSLEYATAFVTIGDLLSRLAQYAEAEKYLLIGLDKFEKVSNVPNSKLAVPNNTLAQLYFLNGDKKKAEFFFKRTLELRLKSDPPDSLSIAEAYDNMGIVFYESGEFLLAQDHILKGLRIREKLLSSNDPEISISFNNLGNFYKYIGNYSKSKQYYKLALNQIGNENESNLYYYPAYTNNLGSVLRLLTEMDSALHFNLKGLEAQKRISGENHPDYTYPLNSLGVWYYEKGLFKKALNYYGQALKIQAKQTPLNEGVMADLRANLASIYMDKGENKKADSLMILVYDARLKLIPPTHPDVNLILQPRGMLAYSMQNEAEADKWLIKLHENQIFQVKKYFPFLSTIEKEKFFESLRSGKDYFQSYCAKRQVNNKQFASLLYDNQLATKAILLSNNKKQVERIRNLKDSVLLGMYQNWQSNRELISRLRTGNFSKSPEELSKLEEATEKLEKDLARATESIGNLDLNLKSDYTWKDVKKKLRKGEVAVEIIRIRQIGIAKTITDTTDQNNPVYKVKGLSDNVLYAALIVRPNSVFPEVVILENRNDLESKRFYYYKNRISLRSEDDSSFKYFWKKISRQIGNGVKTIHFSPDGIYNNVNLNTLKNPKTGKYLIDEVEIRIISSTRELVAAKKTSPNPAYACLVGYPDFNIAPEKRLELLRYKSPAKVWNDFRATRNEPYSDLPGTKVEVENISEILRQKGWRVNSFLRNEALEENIKATKKPRVLHIATHGYFQPDDSKDSNPLLYSGLILSGANKAFSNEVSDQVEDGVLTAYEAMNLNLDQTELVVLSACETGLGTIKNGEGVYGLQRAFTVAGAKSVLMSLWKVDDIATQELMINFYKNWLSQSSTNPGTEGAKKAPVKSLSAQNAQNGNHSEAVSIRSAFLKAQKQMKEKYKNPFYWGAFVLFGE